MNLVEKLLQVPQRENAGARSSNRFTYQQVWAFNYMLDIIDKDQDFILFMEFHDDILVLGKSTNTQVVDFYQIKTDNKPSRYITQSFITKNANKYPEKMSIAQKMIENFIKFENDTRGVYLVSNKSFDFGLLNDESESINRDRIVFEEINAETTNKIKDGMCQSCTKKSNCMNECIKIIHFVVSNLDVISYEETVLGRFINKLDSLGIESYIGNTKSLYNTILGEIRRINNCERSSQNVFELLNKKAISKENFLNWINSLRQDLPDDLWNQIQPLLLNDGFSSIIVNRIMKQWKKYKIDSMNVDISNLESMVKKIQLLKNTKEFDNIKTWTEFIYGKISNNADAKIYEKDYLYAVIIKELLL